MSETFSLKRIRAASSTVDVIRIGAAEAKTLPEEDAKAYALAHDIVKHLSISAPLKAQSGHPGGPLSAFTFSYGLLRRRDPKVDAALRMSAGHLSVLAYALQYLGGRVKGDKRLESPQAIIDSFRKIDGLPGHVEAGIGDIPFGTGPLGKGLSNGLGFALGWKMQGKSGYVDVLESDGSLQEGQSMEAMRLAFRLGLDRLVVHGDINDIQLSGIPSKTVACDIAAIFQSMGWAVIEVQNGNDPSQVEAALDASDRVAGNGRPVFVCYYTTMGYGIDIMEKASDAGSPEYHGSPMKKDAAEKELKKLPPLDTLAKDYEPIRSALAKRGAAPKPGSLELPTKTARIITKEKGAARKDFGAVHIKNLMKHDDRIIVLHADLGGSGGFDIVEKEFPSRVLNCGVAEANMYMMAAGLRQAGFLPVTYTFAAFGTNEARANARLIDINCGHTPCGALHDCTHAGLSVGEDGETHQDRNYLNIPFDHTQVWVPADSNQAAAMAEAGLNIVAEGHQSVYVFSGRTGHPQLLHSGGEALYGADYIFDGSADIVYGKGDSSDRATIIATGGAVHDAVKVADLLAKPSTDGARAPVSVRVLNVACVRPIDASAVIAAALETQHLIVVEDHHSEGGLATQVADVIADFQLPCSLRRLGVNHYFPSGPAEDLKFLAGLDPESIENAVLDEISLETPGGEDAFVSFLHSLPHHLSGSRFRTSAAQFIEKLLTDKSYAATLREHFAKRACPPEKMPTTKELLARLRKEGEGL